MSTKANDDSNNDKETNKSMNIEKKEELYKDNTTPLSKPKIQINCFAVKPQKILNHSKRPSLSNRNIN